MQRLLFSREIRHEKVPSHGCFEQQGLCISHSIVWENVFLKSESHLLYVWMGCREHHFVRENPLTLSYAGEAAMHRCWNSTILGKRDLLAEECGAI